MNLSFRPPVLELLCIGCPPLSSKIRNLDKRTGGAPFGGFTPLSCLKQSNTDFLGLNYPASIVSLPALAHSLPFRILYDVFNVSWNRTRFIVVMVNSNVEWSSHTIASQFCAVRLHALKAGCSSIEVSGKYVRYLKYSCSLITSMKYYLICQYKSNKQRPVLEIFPLLGFVTHPSRDHLPLIGTNTFVSLALRLYSTCLAGSSLSH